MDVLQKFYKFDLFFVFPPSAVCANGKYPMNVVVIEAIN
jgi:hypothetical protein